MEFMTFNYTEDFFTPAELQTAFTKWISEHPELHMKLDRRPYYNRTLGCYCQDCHSQSFRGILAIDRNKEVEIDIYATLNGDLIP